MRMTSRRLGPAELWWYHAMMKPMSDSISVPILYLHVYDGCTRCIKKRRKDP